MYLDTILFFDLYDVIKKDQHIELHFPSRYYTQGKQKMNINS